MAEDTMNRQLAAALRAQIGEELRELDYHPQAGCPREHSGGAYRPNVTGPAAPLPPVNPRPFRLGR